MKLSQNSSLNVHLIKYSAYFNVW